MSFASYKSPFDEALSKPLIGDNDDTAAVSRTSTNTQAAPSNKRSLRGKSIGGGPSSQNSNDRSVDASAAFSKKLSVPHSKNNTNTNTNTNTNISNASSSKNPFENFDIDQGRSNTDAHRRQDDDEYHPPNLTLETSTAQTNSLEAALLRERNEESRSILQKMNTISAITSELNSLVQGQQDMVDDVEDNAYGVHDAAERGVNELERASRLLQRNNGSGVEVFWKFFFGVIGVGGLIVAFVIFLHSM